MAEGRGAGADLDLRVQQLVVPRADGVEKVLHVRRGVFARRLFLERLFVFFFAAGAGASRGIAADVPRRALVDLKAGVIDDEEPGGAEEDIADVVGSAQDGQTLGRRGQVAYVEGHLRVAEVEGGLLGVRRFL